MLKLIACAALALSIAVTPAMAQDTTATATQDSATTRTKKGRKNKAGTGDVSINNTLCPVMGHDVKAMGHPYEIAHNGQKVLLCCESCKDKFMADPDKMVEKAKASAKK